VVATGIDITERRKAEEHEHQRMLELAHVARLGTMGEMATEIAHELNQPLTAIATYSDGCRRLLETGSWDTADLMDAADSIHKQARRAGDIIRRLRKFARKEDPQRLPVGLNELVEGVVQLTALEAGLKDVAVVLDLSGDIPLVLADQVLIEQVLINLIRNAIEIIDEHDCQERRLLIQTWVNGTGMPEVAVTDTGPGLSDQALVRVFEPFFTTKAAGMGMGLSLSQSIVEAHGGHLWAISNPPQGATFGFTLPLAEQENEHVG
jgi:C4-dicarboxylate-specific signal transduction histidine kinase